MKVSKHTLKLMELAHHMAQIGDLDGARKVLADHTQQLHDVRAAAWRSRGNAQRAAHALRDLEYLTEVQAAIDITNAERVS